MFSCGAHRFSVEALSARGRAVGVLAAVLGLLGLSAVALAGSASAAGAQLRGGSSNAGGGTPAGVVVVFDRGVRGARRAAIAAGAHTRAMRTLGHERFQLLAAKRGQSVHAAVAVLRRAPGVEAADPNRTFTVADVPNVPNPLMPFVPNDPLFGDEWALQNTGQQVPGYLGTPATDGFAGTPVPGADISATLAWDRTIGDRSTVVADIDTGYFFEHPDLARALPGWDTLYNNNDATDDPGVFGVSDGDSLDPPGAFVGPLLDSHGVHTAGIIGAQGNNGIGVTGVDPNVTIMPILALDSFTGTGTLASVIAAMNYAGQNGARAANMSVGASAASPTVQATQAQYPNTLFVVAAGNSSSDDDTSPQVGCDNPTVAVDGYTPPPGAIDNVVCVAATDPADNLASFSDYGATSVDLAAPGVDILSTQPELTLHTSWVLSAADFANWTTPSPPADDASSGFTDIQDRAIGNVPNTFTRQPAGSTRATQSPAIALPADATGCRVQLPYFLNDSGDDSFSWSVILDGTTVLVNRTEPQNNETTLNNELLDSAEFAVPPGTQANPHTIALQFVLHSGLNDASPAFVGISPPGLDCASPGYGYLSGTSQATPMVTGTAALMFSLDPSATVTQVRNALLAGVDPLPSLAGKTVTGGRLDAWKALAALVPMDTRITSGPSGTVKSTSATFAFDTNNTGNADFQCSLDGGPFQACASPQTYTGLENGSHSFAVRSAVAGGVDTTPATAEWSSAAFTSTIAGNHTGALTVGAGQNVLVSPGAVIAGTVTVQKGGSLDIESAKLTGSLTGNGAGSITACGATITGPVTITAATGQVTFGDGGSCAGNTITGPVNITGGTGPGVAFSNNTVTGPVTITHNHGTISIGPNKVVGKITTTPNP